MSRTRSVVKSATPSRRGRSATPPDGPTIELGEDFWRYAEILMPGERPKRSLHLRVDHDVADWFKHQGKGHLTRMNAVLRAYYEANRGRKPPARKKAS